MKLGDIKVVIDDETGKVFDLISFDAQSGTALIYNKEYGHCSQELHLLTVKEGLREDFTIRMVRQAP